MTITESQLASLHERHAAQQDEIIKRLMERIDHMNEEVRLLNEENRKMTDELKNNPPVIRCKDCKNRKYCEINWSVDGDWYCANGDRKDGEQNAE